MKKNDNKLGTLIKDTREKLGVSQRELSRQANMDPAELSRVEKGTRKKPNVLYLKGISETLNLSMVELMKLAGYSDIDINLGKDFSDRRSTVDYQKQIKSYEEFYFNVLEDIEERRKNAFACKGIIAELIYKIENKEISNDMVLEDLKELLTMIRPNLEKFDKSKYPSFDKGVIPNMEIKSNIKYQTIPQELLNKKD